MPQALSMTLALVFAALLARLSATTLDLVDARRDLDTTLEALESTTRASGRSAPSGGR